MIRILVALDGSELSEQALLHGAAIAQAFDSEIVLLRVLSCDERNLSAAVDPVDWQLHRRQAEAYLERRAEELTAAGLNVNWVIEEGKVAERLICFAQNQHVDLIILGALGRSGIGPFDRGGTAQKVTSAATTSVLIAPPREQKSKLGEFRYRRILVPVDGSCGSQWALNMASAIAEIHGAELILTQIIETPELWATVPGARETRELQDRIVRANRAAAEQHLRGLKAILPHNLKASCEVTLTEHVPSAIDELANARDADLVVLSAHSDRRTSGWRYGPVPEFLLAHTNRPVLVFQHGSSLAESRFRSVFLPLDSSHANVS